MEENTDEPRNKRVDGREHDDVQLVFIDQESVSIYEIRDSVGDVVNVVIAEGIDDPERFRARSDAERDSMKMLALDEYYKGTEWEGPAV